MRLPGTFTWEPTVIYLGIPEKRPQVSSPGNFFNNLKKVTGNSLLREVTWGHLLGICSQVSVSGNFWDLNLPGVLT